MAATAGSNVQQKIAEVLEGMTFPAYMNNADNTKISTPVLTDIDSVRQWLEDLRWMTETECMTVLQGKTIQPEDGESLPSPVRNTKEHIKMVRKRAHIITAECAKLFHKLDKERWKKVHSNALRITCTIRSLLHDISAHSPNLDIDVFQQQQVVMEECAQLIKHVESIGEINGEKPQKLPMVHSLTCLGQAFTRLIDKVLAHEVRTIVEGVADSPSAYCIKASITSLVGVAQGEPQMCHLIVKEGGVRALFTICRQDTANFVKSQALRAVATLCSVPEAIAEVEKVDGVGCLTDILCDPLTTEATRTEVAGVLAQITSPMLDHYRHVSGFIENMEDLLRGLIGLCETASSPEVFLLGSAAIANITFLDSMASEFLARYQVARVLITSSVRLKVSSIFIKDQLCTVLANVAMLEQCREDIIQCNGLTVLVGCLHEKPPYNKQTERVACERVQQKAAIALARLCKDVITAGVVKQLKGLQRLVELCRKPKERNYSDSVLVACLATLRKLASVCCTNMLLFSRPPSVSWPVFAVLICYHFPGHPP
ncbi:protein inscuteable homolog isoform X3 [Branchiostoma floridae]|uniref:Protein inscuteable homolog isoform X3 n=1 Tax=Branchiostoma floridae TaxID=7739 RepID=A0A9J7HNF6_BRAFL|nr:protein inscuteable homolog isoform X3 [Branchiostoma floridae]